MALLVGPKGKHAGTAGNADSRTVSSGWQTSRELYRYVDSDDDSETLRLLNLFLAPYAPVSRPRFCSFTIGELDTEAERAGEETERRRTVAHARVDVAIREEPG